MPLAAFELFELFGLFDFLTFELFGFLAYSFDDALLLLCSEPGLALGAME
jgi:hypothetical protein